jgi:hypothetical protein
MQDVYFHDIVTKFDYSIPCRADKLKVHCFILTRKERRICGGRWWVTDLKKIKALKVSTNPACPSGKSSLKTM